MNSRISNPRWLIKRNYCKRSYSSILRLPIPVPILRWLQLSRY